jgi:hypothetical protein
MLLKIVSTPRSHPPITRQTPHSTASTLSPRPRKLNPAAAGLYSFQRFRLRPISPFSYVGQVAPPLGFAPGFIFAFLAFFRGYSFHLSPFIAPPPTSHVLIAPPIPFTGISINCGFPALIAASTAPLISRCELTTVDSTPIDFANDGKSTFGWQRSIARKPC